MEILARITRSRHTQRPRLKNTCTVATKHPDLNLLPIMIALYDELSNMNFEIIVE